MLLLNAVEIYCFSMNHKQVNDGILSPALIITVLVSTVLYPQCHITAATILRLSGLCSEQPEARRNI